MIRNGHIAAAAWLVLNTLDGCQATNKITDTGIARSRESFGLVLLGSYEDPFAVIGGVCLSACQVSRGLLGGIQ